MEPEDFKCYLCLGILFYPVRLPCKHVFCKECLMNTVKENRLQCPLCRKRLSVWLRRVKEDSKIDEELWSKIQKKFPKIKHRINEIDSQDAVNGSLIKSTITFNQSQIDTALKMHEDVENFNGASWCGWECVFKVCRDIAAVKSSNLPLVIEEYYECPTIPNIQLAKPGEIREEFQKQFEREEEERRKIREEQIRRNEEAIRLIKEQEKDVERLNEEKLRALEQLRQDEELAKKLAELDSTEEPQPKNANQNLTDSIEELQPENGNQNLTVISVSSSDATNSSPFKNSADFERFTAGHGAALLRLKLNEDWREIPSTSTCDIFERYCTSKKSSETSNIENGDSSAEKLRPISSTPVPGSQPPCFNIGPKETSASSEPMCSNDGLTSTELTPSSSYHSASTVAIGEISLMPKQEKTDGDTNNVPLSSAGDIQSRSAPISNKELSNFAAVVPGPSTSSTIEPSVPRSRCSSGADSIGQELHHFKPIRASPTTPPKDGSSECLPQLVMAQKAGILDGLKLNPSASCEVLLAVCENPDLNISNEDLRYSIEFEERIDADKEFALLLQSQLDNDLKEESRKRKTISSSYNLRKKGKTSYKGSLRKNVLVGRAQATLDKMLIK